MTVFDFRELMRQHPTPLDPTDGIMVDCAQFMNVALAVHGTSVAELLMCMLTQAAADGVEFGRVRLTGATMSSLAVHARWLAVELGRIEAPHGV